MAILLSKKRSIDRNVSRRIVKMFLIPVSYTHLSTKRYTAKSRTFPGVTWTRTKTSGPCTSVGRRKAISYASRILPARRLPRCPLVSCRKRTCWRWSLFTWGTSFMTGGLRNWDWVAWSFKFPCVTCFGHRRSGRREVYHILLPGAWKRGYRLIFKWLRVWN